MHPREPEQPPRSTFPARSPISLLTFAAVTTTLTTFPKESTQISPDCQRHSLTRVRSRSEPILFSAFASVDSSTATVPIPTPISFLLRTCLYLFLVHVCSPDVVYSIVFARTFYSACCAHHTGSFSKSRFVPPESFSHGSVFRWPRFASLSRKSCFLLSVSSAVTLCIQIRGAVETGFLPSSVLQTQRSKLLHRFA